jgi:hypothetical protein
MSALDLTGRPQTDPVTLSAPEQTWTRWLGPLISLALLGGVLRDYSSFDLPADIRLLAASPAFWGLFVLYFLSTPL